MMAQRDPWVNMLRTTLAAFAAGVGGADTVGVHTFDSAIPGGFPGTAASFARRMARNTQLLLLEESHVGRVLDPGGGSWFVEDLTRALAEQAWAHFQRRRGQGRLRRRRRLRRRPDRRGSRPSATTTSRTVAPPSPVSTSIRTSPKPPLPPSDSASAVVRYGAAFEALRDRSDAYPCGQRCAPEGAAAAGRTAGRAQHPDHLRRQSAGVRRRRDRSIPGRSTRPGWRSRVAAAGTPAAVVICGTDARYADEASAVVEAARAAGVSHVYLAGPEKAVADAAHKPDDYLTAKIDAIAALSTLLTRLGA